MKQLKNNTGYLMILAVLVIFAYFNSLGNTFVSDDKSMIVNYPTIGFFESIIRHPFSFSQSILVNLTYKIAGFNPTIYRLINIFFHIGSVWIIFLLFSLLSNSTIAFFTAGIFAIHPILTESVTWISGGIYVKYSFFFLLSLFIYIQAKNSLKKYLLAFIFFVISLFSSDKAIVIPLLFFTYELSLGNLRHNWKRLLPFFGVTIIRILFYIPQISTRITGIQADSYQRVEPLNPLVQVPIAITSYIQLIFWPDKLTLYHSEMSFGWIEYWIRVAGVLGLMGIIVWGWKKNKFIFFCLSLFLISLLPTLTPLGISWIVAERYVYLGTVGVLGVMSYALWGLIKNKKSETIGYLIAVLLIIGLTARTIARNIDWKNEDNLWIATAKTSPTYHVTHNNLGDVFARHGRFDRAAEEFKLAIKLNPNYADAYHNLGNVYRQMGKTADAFKSYQTAARLNPQLWQSYENIARLYFDQGDYAQAENQMLKAISAYPANANLYVNLGLIYLREKNKNKAREAFQQALSLDSANANAKIGLAELN